MAPYGPQLSYQVCPIILTGGIASQIPGGMLPVVSLLVTAETSADRLPLILGKTLDDAFGAFNVLPGGTLISQTIGKYPFANQSVAANAIIREPLTLSMIMDSPMRSPNAWIIKQSVFTALKSTLDAHNAVGGTYTVATPAYIYDNMLLTSLTDNSRGNNSLPQNAWRFDFERPLVAIAELQGAQNQFIQKISKGVQSDGNLSGPNVGTQSAQAAQAGTIRVAGGLMGGTPPVVGGSATQGVANFPAVPNQANFAFTGIS